MLSEVGLIGAVLAILMGTIGPPLGIPPGPEDPLLAKIAPEKCLFYMSWAGRAPIDPNSQHRTERLLADEQTKRLADLLGRFATNSRKAGAQLPPEVEETIERITNIMQRMAERPTALFVESFNLPQEGPPEIALAAICRFDADTAQVDADWTAALQALNSEETKVEEAMIGRYRLHQVVLPKGLKMTWGPVGNYFVIAYGDGTLERMLERARGQAPAWMAEIDRAAAGQRIATRAYVDLTAVRALGASELPPEGAAILAAAGVDQAQALYSVTGLDQHGFVARSWIVHSAPPTGLLAAAPRAPLAAADFASIPADATFALVLRCDADQAFEQFMQFGVAIEPRSRESMERDIRLAHEELGIHLRTDLLQSLGSSWRIYSSPTDGAFVLPGLSLVADAKNPAKLQEILGKIAVQLAPRDEAPPADFPPGFQLPPRPSMGVSKVGAVDVYTLTIPGGFPATPTFAVVGDKFIVAASPIAIRSFINRKGTFQSLADSPVVQRALAAAPQTTALTYIDMPQVVETYGPLLPSGLQFAAKQMPGGAPNLGQFPAVEELAQYLEPSVVTFQATERSWEWTQRQTAPGLSLGQGLPVATAILVPAVLRARDAARRIQVANNLRMISLVFHVQADETKKLPAAYIADKEGNPLLSWRVAVLPNLDPQVLEQFKLDEPWDSQHNQKLLERMPEIYKTHQPGVRPGYTTIQAVRLPDSVLPSSGKARSVDDITDGAANTIMLVEVAPQFAVPWTKPDDYVPEEKNPAKGLAGSRSGGFNALFADGAIHFLPEDIDKATLWRLFNATDGQPVEIPE